MKIFKQILISATLLTSLFAFTTPALAAGLSLPAPTTKEYTVDGKGANGCSGKTQQQCLKDNPIVIWINFFVNLFAAVVLVGAAAMMTYAGVQYAAAADNPERLKAAKKLISDIIVGILAFFFLYAFMQWLIPGGIF